ncbi:hypothetical protein DFQ27_001032 [Actinomortierella ambigua]|uniref:Serine-threonine/tyrosine-protein kinase catalytic domain-containing protein n=1 Tax=Actinomortierella ambigua TaxID=1343610 RepID=A0A9P6QDL5_9FUNG|nr:hypothetical protein DFQ27_001032 [Actinomortierella ambigua]
MAANYPEPFHDQQDNMVVAMLVRSGEREEIPEDTPDEYRSWIEQCWRQDRSQRPNARDIILEDDDAITTSGGKDIHPSSHQGCGDEVMNHIRKTASKGNADAQLFLGWMCVHGLDVVESCGGGDDDTRLGDSEAAKWYRMAAERGESKAQLRLGVFHFHGRSVGRDHAEAARWFRKAANQGLAEAQFNLGLEHPRGRPRP